MQTASLITQSTQAGLARLDEIATPDDPKESLPYWFDLACKDLDWIRLLEWEALQFVDRGLIDEDRRRDSAVEAVERVLRRQKLGFLSDTFTPKEILLAMISLTWFPVAFPQLTRSTPKKRL